MMSWNEPDFDESDQRPAEQDWPGELPESVEAWLENFVMTTYDRTIKELADAVETTPGDYVAYAMESVGVPRRAA